MSANFIVELEERNMTSWAYKKPATLLRDPLCTHVGIEGRKMTKSKETVFNKTKEGIFDIKIAFFKKVGVLQKGNNIEIVAKFCF